MKSLCAGDAYCPHKTTVIIMFTSPYDVFHRADYLDINLKRFDHLDYMNIAFQDKTILEVGAGIGDHTDHLLRYKPKSIHVTDVREENILILKEKYVGNKHITVSRLDMDKPMNPDTSYDICYCYGLLYHLSNPGDALLNLASYTKDILLMETCVDYFNKNSANFIEEERSDYSQSYHGKGSRPGRSWIYDSLKKYFPYVYVPLVQPDHAQFPTNWTMKEAPHRLTRSIFIASRRKIENHLLFEGIPPFQVKYRLKSSNFNVIIVRSLNFLHKKFLRYAAVSKQIKA